MGHRHIEKYTALDTSRGCGRMVVGSIGIGIGGVGAGVSAGLSPGLPAFVAQRAVSIVVPPSGNTETEESRHVDRIPGIVVRAQVQVQVQACVGDIDEVEQERTYTYT